MTLLPQTHRAYQCYTNKIILNIPWLYYHKRIEHINDIQTKLSSTYHDFTTTNASSISTLHKQDYPQHTMTLPPQTRWQTNFCWVGHPSSLANFCWVGHPSSLANFCWADYPFSLANFCWADHPSSLANFCWADHPSSLANFCWVGHPSSRANFLFIMLTVQEWPLPPRASFLHIKGALVKGRLNMSRIYGTKNSRRITSVNRLSNGSEHKA